MGYKELRVWARGRGNGWESKELEFYIKIGRDPDNFYMYRVPAHAGPGRNAWQPEVRVDFERFYRLRAQVQNAFLQSKTRNSCTGVDSALIANSKPPAGKRPDEVYAACADGYVVYTADPNVTPPNLAAVQELSVGFVRVAEAPSSPDAIMTGDTLEVWVDDIRLTNVVDTPGYAGQIGVNVIAGDIANFRVNTSRRDPNFRQLAEQPSYVTDNALDVGSDVHLERFLPQSFGYAMPLTVNYSSSGSDPFFISRSDVRGAGINRLRTPQSSSASYALSLRRITPLETPVLGTVLNNLALTSTYGSADSRNEYSTGNASNWTVGLDYTLAAQARSGRIPGLLDRVIMHLPDWLLDSDALRAFRGAKFRWNPTQFRLTSAMARSTDQRISFSKPAATDSDRFQPVVRGLNHIWRNGSAIEFRPVSGLSARWDITSLRDLRAYDDTNSVLVGNARVRPSLIAAGERQRFAGLDVGLERERQMSASFSIAPAVASWLRPHADFGTTYGMLRDPNPRTLLRDGTDDSSGAYRLPRRLQNGQTFSAGATVDIPRFLLLHTSDSSFFRRFTNMFQPVDVNFNHSLSSAFDGTPFTPGLAYQFGLGGVSSFRSLGGRRSTSTGLNNRLSVSHSVALPFGIMLANQYERASTSTWTGQLDNSQQRSDNDQQSFPKAQLRWSYRPPAFLLRVISSIGGNLGYTRTENSNFTPGLGTGATADQGRRVVKSMPMAGTIAWSLAGGFSTAAGYDRATNDDQRPGNHNSGETKRFTAEVGKPFHLPAQWKLTDQVSTRLSYERSSTVSNAIIGVAGTAPRPLANNERRAVNFNADTQLSQTLSGSLLFSRVLNIDNQNDRRFSQMVFTAVLSLQFFAGELK
jgi:hypothetical protein